MKLFRYIWPSLAPSPNEGCVTLMTAACSEDAVAQLARAGIPAGGGLEEVTDCIRLDFQPCEIAEDDGGSAFEWLLIDFDRRMFAEDGVLPASLSEERFDVDAHWSDNVRHFEETQEGLVIRPNKRETMQ